MKKAHFFLIAIAIASCKAQRKSQPTGSLASTPTSDNQVIHKDLQGDHTKDLSDLQKVAVSAKNAQGLRDHVVDLNTRRSSYSTLKEPLALILNVVSRDEKKAIGREVLGPSNFADVEWEGVNADVFAANLINETVKHQQIAKLRDVISRTLSAHNGTPTKSPSTGDQGTCNQLPKADYTKDLKDLLKVVVNSNTRGLRDHVVDLNTGRSSYHTLREPLTKILNEATRDEKKAIGNEVLGTLANIVWDDVPAEIFAANLIDETANQVKIAKLRDVISRILSAHSTGGH